VAVGMAYMYKVKGATGVEMVPNIDFWRDLPALLKVRMPPPMSVCITHTKKRRHTEKHT
jgi:hypothetical protein